MGAVDVAGCRQRIERCFPAVGVRSCTPVQEGWGSLVLVVNDDTIFRFPRRPEIIPALRREMALLPVLAGALSVAVPRVQYLWNGTADGAGPDGWPFVGYRRIAGAPLQADFLGPALAAHLAAVLGELHAFPAERAAALALPGGTAGDWRREYEECYGWVQQLVWPLLAEAERTLLAACWERFLGTAAYFSFRPTLVHRDLWGSHILCDPAASRVNGIIDWEDAAIGDPAIDFAGLLLDCGPERTRQVLAHYPGQLGGSFWERIVFYARIAPVYEVRFGLETGQSAHVDQGLADLRAAAARGGVG